MKYIFLLILMWLFDRDIHWRLFLYIILADIIF